MNLLQTPVPLPRSVIERIRSATPTTTATNDSKPEWYNYFLRGREALFDREEWKKILITLGRRILVGEQIFHEELSANTGLLEALRLWQTTHTAFLRYCFDGKPQLKSLDTWSCYSTATQAVRVCSGEVPEEFPAAEKRCIFTDSGDAVSNVIVWYQYVVTDPITKIQHVDTSPSFVVSRNYLMVLQSLMAVGQAEFYLNEALHTLIKDAKAQRNDHLAMDLLKTALTNTQVHATVSMINNAAYFLFMFHEIATLLRL